MSQPALAAVARLTESLSRATTLEAVYDGALDALQGALGVDRASILLFNADGVMSFTAWRGLSDSYRAAVHGHTPWRPDSRDATAISIADVHADESLARFRPIFDAESIRALGFFPLISGDRVIGKFMLYYREPHACTDDELQVATTIAGQIAFGVVRIRTELQLACELAAQQLAQRRTNFLAEASDVLASSLDYSTTLEQVAELAVREIADWCAIDMIEEGEVLRLAATHRDPSRAAAVAKMRSFALSRQRSGSIRWVLEHGEPRVSRQVDWKAFEEQYADDPDVIETFRELGFTSHMAVPLIARGHCLGVLTFASASEDHLFTDDDLQLALELGRRAGYAIDNARLYRDAQEANRAKDEFLVTLSHELRTPMTATLGWASMLRRDLPPETFRVAIDTIDRSTRAQAKLVEDILDVSRIIAGKLQLSVTPLNVRDVVEAAIEAIRPSITAKQLDLVVNLSDKPAVAVADAARIQQVLWNLLSNAVKFTPSGGTVSVTLEPPAGDHVRVTVADTGTGISRKFLPHVFERFRQADSSATRTHGGLGLGLAIVKNLVELHGGQVSAESPGEGQGATFTIALPLAVPLPAAIAPPGAALPVRREVSAG